MSRNVITVLTITLVASLLSMPACSTINPYTGEKQTSKATEGSAIGGVLGAILGAATASKGHRAESALIGGGIGGLLVLLGGIVGLLSKYL